MNNNLIKSILNQSQLITQMNEKSLVIIPTYNELENIKLIVPDLLGRYNNLDILVVDDNSPDGTGNFISRICRVKRTGLS